MKIEKSNGTLLNDNSENRFVLAANTDSLLSFVYYLHSIHYSPAVMDRDQRKKLACLELGINVITIPYWWNGELSSLATTIHMVRPDIDIPSVWLKSPIPKDIPKQTNTSCMYVLMDSSF